MPEPYIIRLRGPWTLEPVARWRRGDDGAWSLSTDDLPAPVRRIIPVCWSELFPEGESLGVVRLIRSFHAPTGLGPYHRVWLAVAAPLAGEARLGDELLGAVGPEQTPARFDVTQQLQPRNELALEFKLRAERGEGSPKINDAPGEVWLEIMES